MDLAPVDGSSVDFFSFTANALFQIPTVIELEAIHPLAQWPSPLEALLPPRHLLPNPPAGPRPPVGLRPLASPNQPIKPSPPPNQPGGLLPPLLTHPTYLQHRPRGRQVQISSRRPIMRPLKVLLPFGSSFRLRWLRHLAYSQLPALQTPTECGNPVLADVIAVAGDIPPLQG